MKPNRSVLQCPKCEKPLVNIGSKVQRIHPVARFIRDRYISSVMLWFLAMPFIIYGTTWAFGGGSGNLSLSFGTFALAMLPFVINFALLRLFPVWRITDCPYCGFHEKQKLGLSESGEL